MSYDPLKTATNLTEVRPVSLEVSPLHLEDEYEVLEAEKLIKKNQEELAKAQLQQEQEEKERLEREKV